MLAFGNKQIPANDSRFPELCKTKGGKKLLFLPHLMRQMTHPDRMISTSEVRKVIFEGELIEDYPEDARGHSCLILGLGDADRAMHVVCSPKDEYLIIITAYIPSADQWANDFKSRRKK